MTTVLYLKSSEMYGDRISRNYGNGGLELTATRRARTHARAFCLVACPPDTVPSPLFG